MSSITLVDFFGYVFSIKMITVEEWAYNSYWYFVTRVEFSHTKYQCFQEILLLHVAPFLNLYKSIIEPVCTDGINFKYTNDLVRFSIYYSSSNISKPQERKYIFSL